MNQTIVAQLHDVPTIKFRFWDASLASFADF